MNRVIISNKCASHWIQEAEKQLNVTGFNVVYKGHHCRLHFVLTNECLNQKHDHKVFTCLSQHCTDFNSLTLSLQMVTITTQEEGLGTTPDFLKSLVLTDLMLQTLRKAAFWKSKWFNFSFRPGHFLLFFFFSLYTYSRWASQIWATLSNFFLAEFSLKLIYLRTPVLVFTKWRGNLKLTFVQF